MREVKPDPQRAGNIVRGTLYVRTRQALASVEEVEVLELVCKMNIGTVQPSDDVWAITEKLVSFVM